MKKYQVHLLPLDPSASHRGCLVPILRCALNELGYLQWTCSFGRSASLFKGRKVSTRINTSKFSYKSNRFFM